MSKYRVYVGVFHRAVLYLSLRIYSICLVASMDIRVSRG